MVWRRNRITQRAEQVRGRLSRLLGEDPAQLTGRTVLLSPRSTPVWPALFASSSATASPTDTSPTSSLPTSSVPSEALDKAWLIPPVGHQIGSDTSELLVKQEGLQPTALQAESCSQRWWQRARVDPTRRGVGVAAIGAVVILLILGALFGVKLWQQDAVESAPAQVPQAAPLESSKPRELVVAVGGQVRRPGLVRLGDGARVADAVQAAGGAAEGAPLGNLNLARKIADGELIVVGAPQPMSPAGVASGATLTNSSSATGAAGTSEVPLDLNLATLVQLDALPGVGPMTAQRIVEYRNVHGRFGSVSELRKIDGLGEAKFAKLKPLVTV